MEKMVTLYWKIILLWMSLLGYLQSSDYLVQASLVSNSINRFAVDVYKELGRKEWNFVYSPFSLSTALSTLLVGARRKTAQEIKNILYFDKIKQTDVERDFHEILTQTQGNKPGYQLKIANSLWIQESFDIFSNFSNVIDKIFYTVDRSIEFKSETATQEINKWISKATHGKIPKLFEEPLDPLSKMVLANVVYFHGTWSKEFDAAKNQKFASNNDGVFTSTDVPTMDVVSTFPYIDSEELNAQVLELPYKDQEMSMIVFLPKKPDGLDALEKILTSDKMQEIIGKLQPTEITVKLPKFNTSSSLDLVPVLETLGIKMRDADLSGISDQGQLVLSKAVQKAVIEVNEQGATAAAATGAEFVPYSLSGFHKVSFSADHPFLYLIWHKISGIILFMGRIKTL